MTPNIKQHIFWQYTESFILNDKNILIPNAYLIIQLFLYYSLTEESPKYEVYTSHLTANRSFLPAVTLRRDFNSIRQYV